jgi:phosphonate transport system permease protein
MSLVLEKTGETIALAFIATVLAIPIAIPCGLLASRNLMWSSPISRIVYYVVRMLLNITRSIETLIWAIIFAVWVGVGPFGGTLALFLHSVAALGKLYSEAIEGIDPGPIEAVRATGANWTQVIVYAVLPQFMPSFMSFTLYRWDINVRMATIIGIVAGGGIGQHLYLYTRYWKWSQAATLMLLIMGTVWVIDYVSGRMRARLETGGTRRKAHADSA